MKKQTHLKVLGTSLRSCSCKIKGILMNITKLITENQLFEKHVIPFMENRDVPKILVLSRTFFEKIASSDIVWQSVMDKGLTVHTYCVRDMFHSGFFQFDPNSKKETPYCSMYFWTKEYCKDWKNLIENMDDTVCEKKADEGHSEAMILFGDYLYAQSLFAPDFETSTYLKEIAKENYTKAMSTKNGAEAKFKDWFRWRKRGSKKDFPRESCKKAANLGSVEAKYFWGTILQKEEKYDRALALYT